MPFSNEQEMGKPITIKDEGLTISSNVSSIDFVGDGVSGSPTGSNVVETIPGGGGSYTLPVATDSMLGGIKIGSGLSIADGVLSSTPYSLPTATASVLGGIKVGTRLSIDGNGVLSADVQAGGAGDVVGPAGATADRIAVFDSTTGKLIKDGGKTIAEIEEEIPATPAGGFAGLTALGNKLDSSAFSDAGVTGKLITGFSSGAGSVAATDTILQAINKLDGNVAGKQASGSYLTSVTVDAPLGGAGTSASHLTVDLSSKVSTSVTVAGHALSSNVSVALDDLSDVIIASPTTDQILKYNGSNWVNGAETTVNGGLGVDFFYNTTASDIGGYETLTKPPQNIAEQDQTVTANNNTVLINSFSSPSAGLGGTQIDTGEWVFDVYGYASLLTLASYLKIDIYKRTAGGTETLLFTTNSQYLTAVLSDVSPSPSVQQAFAISATDRLVVKVSGVTANVTNTTIHFAFGGTTHYSHFNAPLVVRHNDLAGLQGGTSNEYYHLTSAQSTVVGNTSGANTGDNAANSTYTNATLAAANLTDNAIVRGDGGAKGVQSSTVTIDDNGDMGIVGQLKITKDSTRAVIVSSNGTDTAAGAFVINSEADGNNSFGVYDAGNTIYYGVSKSLPSPAGWSTLGGYYAGLGVGGSVADYTPIFGVLGNSQSGCGIGNVALTIYGNNTIETYHNTLNDSTGRIGIGITPSANITIKAGTATAGTAPLKFTSGTVNTTAEAGAMEYDGTDLFFTNGTPTRKKVAMKGLAGTKVYYVSDSSGGTVDRKLTFTNGILTAET